MELIIFLLIFGLALFGYNRLMGYKKGQIVLDLEERYTDQSKYVEAVKRELVEEGRSVDYKGNGKFLIDGKTYILVERNDSMGGGIIQRTILMPEK
ncbi:hypothetical protein [Salinicoccus bachuensis]|uniref:Uncharacterized protein n=1 Tax=Salinicoccus bachuensis TaxID=3136731 RepID=A0ABZ3CFW3_9STAP